MTAGKQTRLDLFHQTLADFNRVCPDAKAYPSLAPFVEGLELLIRLEQARRAGREVSTEEKEKLKVWAGRRGGLGPFAGFGVRDTSDRSLGGNLCRTQDEARKLARELNVV